MKLAEALLLRSDYRKKLESLRDRLARAARVQEGDQPPEQPANLLEQVVQTTRSLSDLIFRINQANFKTTLPDGRRMMQVLAMRDTLAMQHSILQNTLNHALESTDRYSSREIRWVPSIDLARTQERIDELNGQIREVNSLIQSTNWQIEV